MKKALEFFKTHYIAVFLMIMIILGTGMLGAGEFLGVKLAWGYGGGVQGSGPAFSPVINSINFPLTINIFQEGTVVRKVGDNQAELFAPKGAVEHPTTFDVQINKASYGIFPKNNTKATIVGGQIFEIDATDSSKKKVKDFLKEVKISLIYSAVSDKDGLGVYWFDELSDNWILISNAVFNLSESRATFEVKHLTKFAVLKTNGKPFSIEVNEAGAGTVNPITKYKNGTLIRKEGARTIYVIKNGKKVRVKSLKELKRYYLGKPIKKVTAQELALY